MTKRMPMALQRYIIEKMVRKQGGDDGDVDSCLDNLDPEFSLTDNIESSIGWSLLKPKEENELEIKRKMNKDFSELKNELITSITIPYYHCNHDKCDFIVQSTEEMIQHFQDKHNFKGHIVANPLYKYDIEYIILSKLVDHYEKGKSKRYIRISNKELFQTILSDLGFQGDDKNAPSNQTPRHALNRLGILGVSKNQKLKTLSYNESGNRVYNISTNRLKEGINNTEYDDLKFRCGLIKNNLRLKPKPVNIKPFSSLSSNVEDEADETWENDWGL